MWHLKSLWMDCNLNLFWWSVEPDKSVIRLWRQCSGQCSVPSLPLTTGPLSPLLSHRGGHTRTVGSAGNTVTCHVSRVSLTRMTQYTQMVPSPLLYYEHRMHNLHPHILWNYLDNTSKNKTSIKGSIFAAIYIHSSKLMYVSAVQKL